MTAPLVNNPTVILVRPLEEGNVGAVARAMANMGLEHLVLVEPAPTLGGVARGFGVGGWHILDSCQRVASLAEATAPFRRLVGTSSTRSRPLRHSQIITSRQLPTFLTHDPPGTATALVFGPEDCGLTRDELEVCEPVVTIPCAPEHPTLNLAQAVLILAYELSLNQRQSSQHSAVSETQDTAPPATVRELETLVERTATVLAKVGIDQEGRQAVYLREMRRFVRRGAATSHQVRLLLRLANRILFTFARGHQVSTTRGGRERDEDDRVRSAEPHPLPRRRLDE